MRLSAPVRAAAQRLTLPLLVFLSGLLAVLGKADIVVLDRVRMALADAVAPIFEMVAQPVASVAAAVQRVEDMAAVYQQNAELREENARLLRWQEAARRLAAENAELRKLTKLAPANAATSISAQVIADSGGAFVRTVLVNVGAEDGVARGQAAMNGEGLVGRVAEIGNRTARILLLTDLNSHIPVVIESTSERAVLDGDNSDWPKLLYLQSKIPLKPGDRIVTSGAGGVFPPGLPVGVVAAAEGGVARVEPYAGLSQLEILRIVDYGLSGVLPQAAVPPPRPVRAVRSRAGDGAQ